MTKGDLFITLPDHNNSDSDKFKPSEIIKFIKVHSNGGCYFTSDLNADLDNKELLYADNTCWLSEGKFIKYQEPVITKPRNRLDLIFD